MHVFAGRAIVWLVKYWIFQLTNTPLDTDTGQIRRLERYRGREREGERNTQGERERKGEGERVGRGGRRGESGERRRERKCVWKGGGV